MTCLATAALCLLIGATAIDGDTLRSKPGPNIRIWGIDAPERDDAAGPAATAAMVELIAGQELACTPVDQDRFGRTVARCELPDGRDLACEMVRLGQARDWPRFSGGAYAACEP